MNMKRNRKIIEIIILMLTMTFLQGCTLAKEGKALENAQTKFIGIWVVLKTDDMELANEINLEDFKKDDAHVLYLNEYSKDGEKYGDFITSGQVYLGTSTVNVGGETPGIDVEGTIYFSIASPRMVAFLRIYEKSSGERYATMGDHVWQVIGDDNYASPGKFVFFETFSEKVEGKIIERKISVGINLQNIRDLTAVKMIYLDENYNVLSEEALDLQNIKSEDEVIQFQVREGAQMVVIEETFKSPKQNEPYLVRTLYSPGPSDSISEFYPEDLISHDFIFPDGNNLAKKVTMNFSFSK